MNWQKGEQIVHEITLLWRLTNMTNINSKLAKNENANPSI